MSLPSRSFIPFQFENPINTRPSSIEYIDKNTGRVVWWSPFTNQEYIPRLTKKEFPPGEYVLHLRWIEKIE